MKIRLGYVAISKTLNITSSSTLTYALYKKLGEKRGNEKLDKVIKSNFESLEEILKYNIKNDISFYRMTSNLIPLATHTDVNYEVFNRYASYFKKIGDIINNNNLRVDTHPDQFCVLNSINEHVVESSINILKHHVNMFEKMHINGKMVLHVGSSQGGKRKAMERFINNFNKLDENIKSKVILENDDKVFNVRNTLKICEQLKIPMVLDYHHHLCNNNGEKIEDFIERIFKTWENDDLKPKIHFSSPKSKKEFRSHSDYVDVDAFLNFLERIKFTNQDIDIMLEVKEKDEALFRLIRQIKYKKNYKFEKNTTFFI